MKRFTNSSEKMIRTSVTVPESMKAEMDKVSVNWSAVVREAIRHELELGHESGTIEAVLINEKLRRKAPESWDSTKEIRAWRNRR